MGNIKIQEFETCTVYKHIKGALDELAWDNTPTGEKMYLTDVWVLKKNEEEGYDLFLRKKGSETYTTHFIAKPTHSMMVELIQSGSIHKDMTNHHRVEKQWTQIKWSVEFDGKSLVALMQYKHKMTYADILNVIKNEGGSVDENGIIHRPE